MERRDTPRSLGYGVKVFARRLGVGTPATVTCRPQKEGKCIESQLIHSILHACWSFDSFTVAVSHGCHSNGPNRISVVVGCKIWSVRFVRDRGYPLAIRLCVARQNTLSRDSRPMAGIVQPLSQIYRSYRSTRLAAGFDNYSP